MYSTHNINCTTKDEPKIMCVPLFAMVETRCQTKIYFFENCIPCFDLPLFCLFLRSWCCEVFVTGWCLMLFNSCFNLYSLLHSLPVSNVRTHTLHLFLCGGNAAAVCFLQFNYLNALWEMIRRCLVGVGCSWRCFCPLAAAPCLLTRKSQVQRPLEF